MKLVAGVLLFVAVLSVWAIWRDTGRYYSDLDFVTGEPWASEQGRQAARSTLKGGLVFNWIVAAICWTVAYRILFM